MNLEKERDRNREFLDRIIENVPSIIFVKNASDRRYVLVNRAAENFWGMSRADILGKTANEVFPSRKPIGSRPATTNCWRPTSRFSTSARSTPRPARLRSIFSRRLAILDDDGSRNMCSASSTTSPSARTRSSASPTWRTTTR